MGAEALYQCNTGYRNVGAGNVSVCTGAGRWEGPSGLCQGTASVIGADVQLFVPMFTAVMNLVPRRDLVWESSFNQIH